MRDEHQLVLANGPARHQRPPLPMLPAYKAIRDAVAAHARNPYSDRVTGSLDYADGGENLGRWWTNASRRIHLLGKGVLRFRAVYWPAMLLSAGQAVPTNLSVHGYLTENLLACQAVGTNLVPFLPAAAARITLQCTPDGTGVLPSPAPLLPRIAPPAPAPDGVLADDQRGLGATRLDDRQRQFAGTGVPGGDLRRGLEVELGDQAVAAVRPAEAG